MGIFKQDSTTFTTYRASLQLRDRIIGGVPKDAKMIEGWLKSRAGIDDVDDLRRVVLRTVRELGGDADGDASYEDLDAALTQIAGEKSTNGFKRDDGGPYIESRQIKALLKEVTNILFAGERWGKTGKGPKSYLAERVFVNPDHIHLGVDGVSGVDLFIGHTSGKMGPQSNLTYIEYVDRPLIEFDLLVLGDCIKSEDWPEIWNEAEEIGLGAMRSQGFGRFDIVRFETAERRLEAVS